MIKTAFDAHRFKWQRNTVDRLPMHDLFFGTPVNTAFAGFPIGDGDMGSLLWLEKDGFHIHVNKCDLWNDAPAGVTSDDEIFCSGRDEALTSLRHGGEITVGFDCPIFEYLYQKDFSARLSLSDATVRINAETPFGAPGTDASMAMIPPSRATSSPSDRICKIGTSCSSPVSGSTSSAPFPFGAGLAPASGMFSDPGGGSSVQRAS